MARLLKPHRLYAELENAGIVSYNYAPIWFWLQEKKGNIIYPRRFRSHRRLTIGQIDSIVKAFSPGGSGIWKLK